jgi:hypothetical protein
MKELKKKEGEINQESIQKVILWKRLFGMMLNVLVFILYWILKRKGKALILFVK